MPNVNPCCSVGVGSRCRYFPAQRGPFHRQRLGEDLFTKFFKEGLHEAGPGVEVSCVHIQVGDIFCCEEAREHASSEDGGDLRLLTVRSGQVPPSPLRLLSHTGHSTQLAKHVHDRNDFPNFQTLFSCLHCYRGSPSLRGCPERRIENRIQGLLWSRPGDRASRRHSWQAYCPFHSPTVL